LFPLTTTEYRVDQNFYRDDKGSKKYIWQK